MCGQHNVRATARDNAGQNIKDTSSPKIEIKISDPAENRTLATGLKGRDSTDHATAMDILPLRDIKMKLLP